VRECLEQRTIAQITHLNFRLVQIAAGDPVALRTKAQAANDFLIWTTVAVTSLSSGQLLHRHGWRSILVTAGPLLALAAAAIITAAIGARAATPAPREA
jgi:hypothetical protein